MPDREGEPDPGIRAAARREELKFFAAIVAALLFAAACHAVPLIVAVHINPWLGVVVSFASFQFWSRVGPPPGPGFVPGILCTLGYMLIATALLGCVFLGLRQLVV